MKHKSIIFASLLILLLNLMCICIFSQDVGYIQIKCEPGAMVLLDDNFVGNTSSELGGLILQDVPAGSYTIKIVKEGFQPQSVRVNLKANEIYVYEVKEFIPKVDVKQAGEADTDIIRQKVGSLLIETIPVDCIIEIPKLYIDKDNQGNKTLKTWQIPSIPVGNYKVNFISLGKKVEYSFEIEEGSKKHLLINIIKNEVKEILPPLTIGDKGPAGGWIFYDKGSYSDGWRYLEAAPASTEWINKQWGSYETLIGGTGTDIGTGQSNTTKIVKWLNSHSETDRAAQLCDALVVENNGVKYSDWFLPSKVELNLMYEKLYLENDGSFAGYNYYWSSSEYDAIYAWGLFGSVPVNSSKDVHGVRVRAVRAF